MLDKWFGGPQKSVKQTNPREQLSGLNPVGPQALIDFNRGLLFGRLKNFGFLFKRGGAWGEWPLNEMLQLETLAKTLFVHLELINEKPGNKRFGTPVEISEHVKQKNMLREKNFQEFLAKRKVS